MTVPLCVNLCVDLLLTCYSHSFGHTGPPVRASISYRRTAQVWSGTALVETCASSFRPDCLLRMHNRRTTSRTTGDCGLRVEPLGQLIALRSNSAELESPHPLQLGEAPL